MIAHVQAINLPTATELLRVQQELPDRSIAWIGVEPVQSPLRHYKTPAKLLLTIPDQVHPSDRSRAAWFHPVSADPTAIPSYEDAGKIYHFVRSLFCDQKNRWCLFVHCTMGLSRSTAIALWTQESFRVLPNKRFEELHPLMHPNPTLLRMLREIAASSPSAAGCY